MSRSLIPALCILLALTSLASCAGSPESAPEPRIGATSGTRLAINLAPGPQYVKKMDMLVFSYTVRPQVAVWLETPEGDFVDTLYVTEVVVSGKYRAAPKNGRPEALPVWTALSSAAKRSVDAISSPTTVGKDVVFGNDLAARLPAGRYIVKLETNRSYDWNATYTKANSGVNGQPSLIYEAAVDIGGPESTVPFRAIGRGSVDGSDGAMKAGLEGIDSALELFSSMSVTYFPG